MKQTSEQLLSYAENELIQKESIRRAVLSEAPAKQKKPVAWTRILLPIAACLVLLCGTVLLIPSARAEVFRWLRIERPEQYLTEDPESRPSSALDDLIVPPATDIAEETVTPAAPEATESDAQTIAATAPASEPPKGSVTKNRILHVCDEPIWQQIAAEFSMELGETVFDGRNLSLAITMRGLTALPAVEAQTGGNATQIRIDKADLADYFEGGRVPDEYLNGDYSAYEWMDGRFWLVLDDGTEVPLGPLSRFSLESNPELLAKTKQLRETYGTGLQTDAVRAQISADLIEWLQGKELRCTVTRPDIDRLNEYFVKDGALIPVETFLDGLLAYADENGVVTGTVLYRINTDVSGRDEIKLEAELGTTSFDLAAYRSVTGDVLKAAEPAVILGPQTISVTYARFEEQPGKEAVCCVTNLPTNPEGVRFAICGDAEINGLRVDGVVLTVTVPDEWTEPQCLGFFDSLFFDAEIEGERFSVGTDDSVDDGLYRRTYTLHVDKIPYNRLGRIDSVRLIPRLRVLTEISVDGVRTPLEPNVTYTRQNNVVLLGDILDLSDGAVTLVRVR